MDIETAWRRIVRYSGETFHQIRGKPFTFETRGRTIYLHTTNRTISRSTIEEALGHVPLANTVAVQHLSAPSYVYAILMDDRIRLNDW